MKLREMKEHLARLRTPIDADLLEKAGPDAARSAMEGRERFATYYEAEIRRKVTFRWFIAAVIGALSLLAIVMLYV